MLLLWDLLFPSLAAGLMRISTRCLVNPAQADDQLHSKWGMPSKIKKLSAAKAIFLPSSQSPGWSHGNLFFIAEQ